MAKRHLPSKHCPRGDRLRAVGGFVQVGAQFWSSPTLTLASVTHLCVAFVASLELPRVSLPLDTRLLEGIRGLATTSTTRPLHVPKRSIHPRNLHLHHVPPRGRRATAKRHREPWPGLAGPGELEQRDPAARSSVRVCVHAGHAAAPERSPLPPVQAPLPASSPCCCSL